MASVEERVAAGAALLDERKPDWFKSIDCAALEISSCNRCICGQLYGDYSTGTGALGVAARASEYGFVVNGGTADEFNEAWREAIAQRRLVQEPAVALV